MYAKEYLKEKYRLQLANANRKKMNHPRNKKLKTPTIVTASTKESNVSDLTTSSCSKNASDGASESTKSPKVWQHQAENKLNLERIPLKKFRLQKLQGSLLTKLKQLILRSPWVYLLPGVQNRTQIKQEADRNYSEFKSLLQKHKQQLINEMYSKYHQQLKEQQNVGI